jgi:hypothetical protein
MPTARQTRRLQQCVLQIMAGISLVSKLGFESRVLASYFRRVRGDCL